jgi:hypothetical protein
MPTNKVYLNFFLKCTLQSYFNWKSITIANSRMNIVKINQEAQVNCWTKSETVYN